jgi:hypothetical protein
MVFWTVSFYVDLGIPYRLYRVKFRNYKTTYKL